MMYVQPKQPKLQSEHFNTCAITSKVFMIKYVIIFYLNVITLIDNGSESALLKDSV